MTKVSNINLDIGLIPPQSVDLEQSVIGAILIDKDAMDNVVNILTPESFYRDENQKIYQVILDLHKKDKAIDILTVTEQLRKKNELEEVGGAVYITDLTAKIASSANIVHHAMYVQEKFIRREQIRISQTLLNASYDDSIELDDLITQSNQLNDQLNELIAGKQRIRRLDDVLSQSIVEVKQRHKDKAEGRKIGIEPPLKCLKDKIYYWTNDLNLLASRPSEGKTNMMLHIAKEAAQNGHPVCIYSLETDAVKLSDRIIIAEANINDYDYYSGYVTEKDIKNIELAAKRLRKLPIYIDDNPVVSVDYIKSHSRLMKKKGKCSLIMVDYIQLTDTSGYKYKSREQEISTITRMLKTHARKLEVPIIALCQLNREIERRAGDKKPKLSDLRESGQLEMDAYLVMFLWRPERYGIEEIDGKSTIGIAYIIIAKNKDGQTGEVKFKHKYGLRYIWDIDEDMPDIQPIYSGKDKQFSDDETEMPF